MNEPKSYATLEEISEGGEYEQRDGRWVRVQEPAQPAPLPAPAEPAPAARAAAKK